MTADRPAGRRPSGRVMAGAGVVTILFGFGAGFALGHRPATTTLDSAATPTPTSTATEGPTTSTTTTSTVRTTSTTGVRPPTTTVPAPTTSVAPTSTAAPTTVTAPPTTPSSPPPDTTPPDPPTTASSPPATTVAPPRLMARYAVNIGGRLVIPRQGSAVITLTNEGGQASQWIISGSGFSLGGGPTKGTLNPGQSATIRVFPPAKPPPPNTVGKLSILGAVNPNVPFVIP